MGGLILHLEVVTQHAGQFLKVDDDSRDTTHKATKTENSASRHYHGSTAVERRVWHNELTLQGNL